MSRARMLGAFATYTPNRKMDARFNRKQYERAKRLADNATPREERQRQKEKRLSYGV